MTLTLDDAVDPRTRRADFVAAMGNAATGVTVVATDGPAGRFAQTVSAMSSVSADPPSLLVCVNLRSPLADAAVRNGVFTVNVLAVDQAHVSDVFAGRASGGEVPYQPYDFGCASWRPLETGAPGLAGAAAVFDCRLAAGHEHGTHRILLGEVLASSVTAARPLVHHARAYGAPRPL